MSDLVRFWLFCKIKSGEITTETGPGKETYPPFVSPVINSFARKLFEKYMAPSCHFELLRFFCFKVTFVSTWVFSCTSTHGYLILFFGQLFLFYIHLLLSRFEILKKETLKNKETLASEQFILKTFGPQTSLAINS